MKSLLILVVMASVASAGPEMAADDKELYARGTKHYDLGEYAAAIDSFRASYDLVPQPLLLFDIAQAYRQLRDCGHARTFYKSYLRNLPAADNRDKVERFLADMDACVATTEREHSANPPAPREVVPRSRALLVGGLVTSITGWRRQAPQCISRMTPRTKLATSKACASSAAMAQTSRVSINAGATPLVTPSRSTRSAVRCLPPASEWCCGPRFAATKRSRSLRSRAARRCRKR